MAKITNNEKLKETIGGIDMSMEIKISELNKELRMLDTFTGVIENEIRNASDSEIKVDFANTLLSCLYMQEAKVKQLIEIAMDNATSIGKGETWKFEAMSFTFFNEKPTKVTFSKIQSSKDF